MNWEACDPAAAGMKRTGADEWHGPCPVHGGDDGFWVRPERRQIGCRPCGGKLATADLMEPHAAVLGMWEEARGGGALTVELGDGMDAAGPGEADLETAGDPFEDAGERPAEGSSPDGDVRREADEGAGSGGGASARPGSNGGQSWTWTTAAGKAFEQRRQPGGEKVWAGDGDGPKTPVKDLLYVRVNAGTLAAIDDVIVTEGASDCDALLALGLPAVGRLHVPTSAASLRRFRPGTTLRVCADNDLPGYRQQQAWAQAAADMGWRVRLIDPLLLRPGAPLGWDMRDWAESREWTPAEAAAAIEAATVDGRDGLLAPDGEPAAEDLRRAAMLAREGGDAGELAAVLAAAGGVQPDYGRNALRSIVRGEVDADDDDAVVGAWTGAGAEALAGEAIDLDAEPPPRRWLVNGLMPHGRLTMLTGAGGSGKSRLMLQTAAAVMGEGAGARMLFPDPDLPEGATDGLGVPKAGVHGRVLWLSWEDEIEEVHRRIAAADAAGAWPIAALPAEALKRRLEVVPMGRRRKAGMGALWGPEKGSRHTSTAGAWLAAGRALRAKLRAEDFALCVIDPLGMAFLSNENDRGLVSEFASSLDALAAETDTAVVLAAHPPKSDARTFSGSTAWEGSVRSLLVLGSHPTGWYETVTRLEKGAPRSRAQEISAPGLARPKGNYAPRGDEVRVWLRDEYSPRTDERRERMAWWATTAQAAARASAGPDAEMFDDPAECKAASKAEGGRKRAAPPKEAPSDGRQNEEEPDDKW